MELANVFPYDMSGSSYVIWVKGICVIAEYSQVIC